MDLIGSGNPVLPADRSKDEKIEKYFDTTRVRNPAPNTLGALGRTFSKAQLLEFGCLDGEGLPPSHVGRGWDGAVPV